MTGSIDLAAHLALFFAALLVAVSLTPLAMRLALRIGLVDRPAPHKFHQRNTPYMGGVAVAGSVLVALVGATLAAAELRPAFLAIGLGGATVATIGLIDDWATIGPIPRLVVQSLAAVGLWLGGIRLTPTGLWPVDLAATVVVVAAVTNAVNLLDNMDGLSTGAVAIASLFLFVAAQWQGQELVAAMTAILAGACLGFLPYNFNPARIFLGDAGTLFMGFVLATAVIELDLAGHPLVTRATVPLAIIAVPLFDMGLVVLSRLRRGQSVVKGGTDHSSHRLVLLGATPRQVAGVTYAGCAMAGTVGLAVLRAGTASAAWAILGAGVLLSLALIRFLENVYARAQSPTEGIRSSDLAAVPMTLSLGGWRGHATSPGKAEA